MKLTKIIDKKTNTIYSNDDVGYFSVNSAVQKYDGTGEVFPYKMAQDASVNIKLIETEIDGAITVSVQEEGKSIDVSIQAETESPKEFSQENIYLSDTYALLRTNPKYTGNVKLVIDSKENLYLDTFKVNTALSKTKYHKVPVSYKNYYGNDVMALFNEMSSDDFYCVSEDDKKIFTQAPNLSKQYIDTYRSGVKTNIDTTYSESFSVLSPINIGSIVPDFFVVFKVENSTPIDINKEDIFEYLIQNGEQIKTFDLRKNSKIGQYLRTVQKHALSVPAPIFMSRMDDSQVVYNGISIDKGVVTKAYETNRRNKTNDSIPIKSYEEMNYNFVEGFERNRLISCNTLNIEFMFDDPTSDQFSINTYVGLYLYKNELYSNIYYDGSIRLDNGSLASDYGYKEINKKSENDLGLIMYGFEDESGFTRCKTLSEEDEYKEKIKNTVGNIVVNTTATKIETDNEYNSFITISLNNKEAILPGEHYRIIDFVKNEYRVYDVCPCIYEVILSDEVSTGEIIGEESIYYAKANILSNGISSDVEICTHTIPIYVNNIDSTLSDEEKINQIAKYMYIAFNSFTTDQKNKIRFKATRCYNSTITINGVVDTNDTILSFERISHLTSYSSSSGQSSVQTLEEFKDDDSKAISVFGEYNLIPMVIDFSDPMNPRVHSSEKDAMFIPFYFEDLKARIVYAVDFYKYADTSNDVSFYDGYIDILDQVLDENLCYIKRKVTDDTTEYSEYDKIKISIYKLENESIVNSDIETNAIMSFRNPQKYMFRFDNHRPIDGKILLHKHNLFNRVICSIVPIKDYDFALNGEDNGWNTTKSLFDDTKSPAKDIVYNLIKIGSSPKNEGYYGEIAKTLIGKLAVSGKSIINSFVSPFIFKWTATGCVSGKSKGSKIVSAKSDIPFKRFDNYNLESDSVEYGRLYRKDLGKIYNNETLRTNIINGKIDFCDIIDEVELTKSIGTQEISPLSDVNFSGGSKLYKLTDSSFGFVERGLARKISFTNLMNTSFLDSINGCVLHNIESKVTGDNFESELYIDQTKKKAYYVSYGDSSIKTYGDEYVEHYSEIIPSNISMDGFGVLTINDEQLVKNKMYIYDCGVNIVLHNDLYTITIENANYNPIKRKIYNISDYNVYSRVTLTGDASDNYDRMNRVECMNDSSLKLDFISKMSHILSKTTPFKLFFKFTTPISTFIQEPVGLGDFALKYLPVYIKFGDESGYTLYEDNYDVSVSSEIVKDSSISPIYTTSTKMPKTINTYITPKLVDVFKRIPINIKMDGGNPISCEKMYGFNWMGDIPYNKYWGVDYNPKDYLTSSDADLLMFDAEFCKTTNGSNEDYPNILRNCFDRKMYHTKSQYKYVKSAKSTDPSETYIRKNASIPVLIERDSTFPGYASGYLIKTFINSLSLQKKKICTDENNSIVQKSEFEVAGWTKIFRKDGFIYYDLSDAIEKQILSDKNFSEIWKYIKANTKENKIKFIKNTIVPMLHITDNMIVKVYFKIGKLDVFTAKMPTVVMKEISNSSVSIEYENDRYLLKLKPQESIKGTYYIKCKITL